MSISDDEARRHLLHGMIGQQHQSRYHNSAAFHVQVDTIAAILPTLISVLAERADASDVATQRMIEMLEKQPVTMPNDMLRELGLKLP